MLLCPDSYSVLDREISADYNWGQNHLTNIKCARVKLLDQPLKVWLRVDLGPLNHKRKQVS